MFSSLFRLFPIKTPDLLSPLKTVALEYIRSAFGFDEHALGSKKPDDVIFISLHFTTTKGYKSNKRNFNASNRKLDITGYGASYLDTRDLTSTNNEKSQNLPQLKTRHITAASYKHHTKATRKFIFGEAEHYYGESEIDILTDLLRIKDDRCKGRLRDVVLVCSSDEAGSSPELVMLSRLGTRLRDIAPVRAIVDVSRVAMGICALMNRESEKMFLRRLTCGTKDGRCAGNTAYATMRAMILMVVLDQEVRQQAWGFSESEQLRRLRVLEKVANKPIPDRPAREKKMYSEWMKDKAKAVHQREIFGLGGDSGLVSSKVQYPRTENVAVRYITVVDLFGFDVK